MAQTEKGIKARSRPIKTTAKEHKKRQKAHSPSKGKRKGDTLSQLQTAFDILVLLQASAEYEPKHLAEKTGLGVKQIGRYLDILESFGVEFDSDDEMERKKPLRLLSVKQGPPFNGIFLTRDELQLLFAHLSGVRSAGDVESRNHLWEKVRNNLGVERVKSEHLSAILGNFEKGYKRFADTDRRKILGELLEAMYLNRPCDVHYEGPNQEPRTHENLEPYNLVEHDGGMYVYFNVPKRKSSPTRTMILSVERIQKIKHRMNEEFRRDPEVVAEIEARKSRAFRISDHGEPMAFSVSFTKEAAPYALAREWHPSQSQPKKAKNGGVTLSFKATGREQIVAWILGWGAACQVVSPDDLRAEVKQKLQAALSRY